MPDSTALKVQGPDTTGTPIPVTLAGPGSPGSTQTQVTGSQNGGNQVNTATLAAAVGKTTYISGFKCTVGGATAAASGTITISGLAGGNITIAVEAPTGATVPATDVSQSFNPPLAASAPNTAISVALSNLGAGNVTASAAAWGYQQ